MSTSITFLRHGKTQATEDGVFCGSTDLPLSEKGEAEAFAAAETLRDERFDVIFYGVKKRVLQTTDIVLSKLRRIPPILLKSEQITETDFGLFEGLSARTIEKKYPDEWNAYLQNWTQYTFPEGDNVLDFYERCSRFIHDVLFEYENNRILIIAHKGFILACLSALISGDIEDVFTRDIGPAQTVTITV